MKVYKSKNQPPNSRLSCALRLAVPDGNYPSLPAWRALPPAILPIGLAVPEQLSAANVKEKPVTQLLDKAEQNAIM